MSTFTVMIIINSYACLDAEEHNSTDIKELYSYLEHALQSALGQCTSRAAVADVSGLVAACGLNTPYGLSAPALAAPCGLAGPFGLAGSGLAAPFRLASGLAYDGLAYPAAAGYGAAYGGAGEGNVAVAGELPVAGTTAVTGQVPIMGAVSFGGPVAAAGCVSIAGKCACGCDAPYDYLY